MVMLTMHLPGQIQLPVSPSLALEDVGDQGILEGIDSQNIEAWRSDLRRTSQLQLPQGTGKLSAVKISNQD